MTKMDKLKIPHQKICWICFNYDDNITLKTMDSAEMLTNCATYLDTSIIKKRFGKMTTKISCCRLCFESVRQLTLLEKQVEKLQNEISDLSLLFSKTVQERRTRLSEEKDEASNQSTLTADKCLTTFADRHSILRDESIENESGELESPGKTEKDAFFTELLLDAFEFENIENPKCGFVIQPEDDIDIKYPTINETDAETETNAQSDQRMITTSMSDLLKCFKTPVLQLQRLQPYPTAEKKVSDINPSYIKSGIIDTEMCSSSIVENIYHPDDNILSPPVSTEDPDNLHTRKCRNFACSFCGKSFLKRNHLREHEMMHTGERPFPCSVCSKSFVTASRLKLHENIHSEERPFKCLHCSKTFKTANNLNSHQIFHSGNKPYKCSFCSLSFHRASHMRKHEKSHSGERPFKCSLCSKTFKTASNLKTHKIIHSGKKPEKCSFCSLSFLRASDLKRHEKIHCGEKQSTSSVSRKSFSQSEQLKDHEVRNSSGEGPYKCSFCPKSFYRLDTASRHETIHNRTVVKPHQCLSCEKTFSEKCNLRYHEKRVHGENTEEFILP